MALGASRLTVLAGELKRALVLASIGIVSGVPILWERADSSVARSSESL